MGAEYEEAKKYAESVHKDFWQRVFQYELEYLTEQLKGYSSILSVGCGPANIEQALVERGFQVCGIDVSKEALERAPESVKTLAASAEDMPFPNAIFDAAIYVVSLQFVEDYTKAIAETARVLKTNGKLVIMLLNPESEFFKARYAKSSSYVQKVKHLNLDEIKNSCAEYFNVETEYFLGIAGNEIYENHSSDAALFIINGINKGI